MFRFQNLRIFAVMLLSACGVASDLEDSKVQSVAPWEDCVGINPVQAHIIQASGGFTIVSNGHAAFHFQNLLEAQRSLNVIKTYNITRSCFVGRPNPEMEYLLAGPAQVAPTGNIPGEDCIGFTRSALQVKLVGGRWKIAENNHLILDFGIGPAAQANAQTGLNVIQRHGFDMQCFIKRPNAEFKYFKKLPVPVSVPVTLSNCTSHTANAGSTFQCPSTKVAAGVSDVHPIIGIFETIRCCEVKAAGATAQYTAASALLPFGVGSLASCASNQYVTGFRYDAAGNLNGVLCRGLQASGKQIVSTGVAESLTLQSQGSTSCSGNRITSSVSDVISPDGHADGMKCVGAVRLP